MQTIRVHVYAKGLPDAVHSTVMAKATPEKTVDFLNKTAQRRGIEATYKLATEEEYWAYRKSLKELIAGAAA